MGLCFFLSGVLALRPAAEDEWWLIAIAAFLMFVGIAFLVSGIRLAARRRRT